MSFMDDWKAEREAAYARPRLNCLDCRASGCIDWQDGEPLCDGCRDSRARAVEALDRQQAEASRRENWWAANDLSHNRDKSFLNFEVTPENRDAVDAVKESVTSGRGVFLLGPAGCGKTHLMYGLTHELLAAGKYLSFVRFDDLTASLRENYGKSDLLLSAKESDNLILDDMTLQAPPTEFISAPLQNLFDYRWDRQLPTWVTSNAGAGNIKISTALGMRLASRIAGLCQFVQISGIDRRRG